MRTAIAITAPRRAEIELRTITPNQEQFDNLTLTYMKAGVPNLAVPQDNILFAFLYETLLREKLKYFLCVGNFALSAFSNGATFLTQWIRSGIYRAHKATAGLSETEFEELMEAEPHEHEEYRCEKLAPFLHKILS